MMGSVGRCYAKSRIRARGKRSGIVAHVLPWQQIVDGEGLEGKGGNVSAHHNHSHDEEVGVKIPATVIGGFLGAGKTTMVNHILSESADRRTDVVVREYGAVAVDDKLIDLAKDRIHVFPGITMHHDPQLVLYDFLIRLVHDKSSGFDNLVLEASGLDTAEGLVQLFFLYKLRSFYRLGSYITVIDAEYGHLNLDEYRVAREQVACADVIVMNKIDLASEDAQSNLVSKIRQINPVAQIYPTTYCQVELAKVLDVSQFDQLRWMLDQPREEEKVNGLSDISSIVLTERRAMDKEKVNTWIAKLFSTQGTKILRGKGFFYFAGDDSDYRFEFQSVRKSFHSKADSLWKPGETRETVIVLIGEGLGDAGDIQDSFSECAAG